MWILERIRGKGDARETAIGYTPTPDGLDLEGVDIKRA